MKSSMIIALLGLCCSACAVESPLVVGPSSYEVIPAEQPSVATEAYVVGPLDTVDITVFQEPQLSATELTVDPSGRLPMPLIGSIAAAGKTADELEQEITQKLARYLVNPNVSVDVTSITQKVIVEGSVNRPGVFDIRGNATLIEALAMAESPTKFADLDEIFVFRRIDGQMRGARFDLQRIRAGIDPDPQILAGDRVVVGLNEVAMAWQDYFAAPIFNVFRVFF